MIERFLPLLTTIGIAETFGLVITYLRPAGSLALLAGCDKVTPV